MFAFNQTFPIGIHIGETGLYAAQFKANGKEPRVRGLYRASFSGEGQGESRSPDALRPHFKKISRDRRFSGKRIALHLPFQSVTSFPVRFQVGKDEGAEEAIVRKTREYLSFPVEEAVIDYISLAPLASGENLEQKAIVTVVKREVIEQYAALAKEAGLVLELVDFPVCSLVRLHRALHGATRNSALLSHIGETHSQIAVLHKDDLIAERVVSWGMRALLKKISTGMGFSNGEQEARLLLRKYGLVYGKRKGGSSDQVRHGDASMENLYRVIYQIIAPAIEEIVDEFHKMAGYLRSEERNALFEGVYIYGHGPLIFDLEAYVEGRLNIPTKLVNPVERMGGEAFGEEERVEAAPFSLALGLAMRKVPWL
jgi:type IV pilus assembly protein PilM